MTFDTNSEFQIGMGSMRYGHCVGREKHNLSDHHNVHTSTMLLPLSMLLKFY